ncbi:UDP-3-O-[3-hydroxymyristoyl] glucosamine N-acyltransferase [Roseiarcus fermentans]|uniref:UDP-3-O-acylglucosamine N-acyltransferase n=1 Tax=Roseiarcus fermentans TaxID=1473586 RepID=A0A366F6W4_9HYPH|nr:UDP-3-O-(3-hydroxymyristoyl)glucosamine N-acyltransferase [Roseiarcus fermentans]RBP09710.1 UDP-3-O-[3-hydroxymyristoyl] glucosamine N-acyltransferase [Roseiarcus fermentans]
MTKIRFFPQSSAPTLAEVASWCEATLSDEKDADRVVSDVAALDQAGPGDLTFLDNPKYLEAFRTTRAAAALVAPRFARAAPPGCATLVVREPYRAMAHVMTRLYPSARKPGSAFGVTGISPASHVHATARLEAGVVVDPGAVIGPGAEIGAGTVIGANAVIGPGVRIGRDGSIGATTTIQAALIGDRVIIHPGVHIGQDGFGFALGARGHLKVPQVGRVIIQDDVEIGAGVAIDRGANRDTVVGEGAKIDNLVMIAHNVVVGRHAVLVSQSGVSGSSVIGDFAALGGQAGIAGHLRIGAGAQVAAAAGVMTDIPPGERWGGAPAKPIREFFREVALVKKLAAARADSSMKEESGHDHRPDAGGKGG